MLHFNILLLPLFQRLGSNLLCSIKVDRNKYFFEETVSGVKIMNVILVGSRLNKNKTDTSAGKVCNRKRSW